MSQLQDWTNQIICGSNPEALKPIPDEIISCVMTSFPYWGQRDYKVKGQMGLEKTFQEWLEKAWLIMDEIWRVLRKDGTCWVNLGDKYGGSGGDHKPHHKNDSSFQGKLMRGSRATNLMDKSLLFIPERFAIGCLDRGWIIRNKCIWQKPNPMPCSAKDRFTTTWEYLYFMTKSKKYWFDLDAVRRPHQRDWRFDGGGLLPTKTRSHGTGWATKAGRNDDNRARPPQLNPAGKNPGDVITTKILQEDAEKMGSPRARQWRSKREDKSYTPVSGGGNLNITGLMKNHPAGANPGDFWSIPTQPSKLAHYASYPEKLCLPPLKAGCPRWICKECGMARCRVTRTEQTGRTQKMPDGWDTGSGGHGVFHRKGRETGEVGKPVMESFTLGWSFCSCLCPACGEADCKCGEKWRPGIVLDPFGGIGTTGIVAKKNGLWYVLIDLKKEYCDMAEKRLKDVRYQEVFDL